MAMASCSEAQEALQSVAQRLQWTYSLLWQLCPHQGALEWAEGHYNGAIKTRKTVQPLAASPAEAAADQEAHYRSRQLRELYDSLAREAEGGGGQAAGVARRPSAALSPEDLTETEWFFLMSASYSFPPGVGLPGKAFSRRGHVWLTGANEVDSKVFSRAILAKSAGIQTVVCIPIVDGVLEIGTIEKVEEDIVLIQYARCIFMDQHDIQMMPTISEHSTSNPIAHIDQQPFQTQRKIYIGQTKVEPNKLNLEGKNNEMEDDDEINEEFASGSETNTEKNYCQDAPLNIVSSDQRTPNAGSGELMQLEMSERVRDGCSNNLDDEIQMLMVCQNSNGQSSMQGQDGPCQSWHFPYEDLCGGQPQWSAEDQAISPENAHYSETVLTILHHNASRQSASNTKTYLAVSHQSSFSRWNNKGTNLEGMITEGTPQRMLKSILFNAPSSHCKYREAQSPEPTDGEGAGGLQRGAVQEDFSANHVLKERRRREKLNERFIILRSLVPFVTKMDKASILGDAIEYVKQLRKRIQDLESRTRQITERNLRQPATSKEKSVHNTSGYVTRASAANQHTTLLGKRKLRAVEGSSSSRSTGKPVAVAMHSTVGTDVQVSIIESDALLELRCPNRDGLLLQIMQALQELQLDVTSVQASSADGVLVAELRAMVKEVHGRRSSITEVKRAIHPILSSG